MITTSIYNTFSNFVLTIQISTNFRLFIGSKWWTFWFFHPKIQLAPKFAKVVHITFTNLFWCHNPKLLFIILLSYFYCIKQVIVCLPDSNYICSWSDHCFEVEFKKSLHAREIKWWKVLLFLIRISVNLVFATCSSGKPPPIFRHNWKLTWKICDKLW